MGARIPGGLRAPCTVNEPPAGYGQMSEDAEAEQFVAHLIATLGPGEALVTAMRVILGVAQATPDDERVLAAASEAIDAVQRIAFLAGYAQPASDPDVN